MANKNLNKWRVTRQIDKTDVFQITLEKNREGETERDHHKNKLTLTVDFHAVIKYMFSYKASGSCFLFRRKRKIDKTSRTL